jgi:hypothetical protein
MALDPFGDSPMRLSLLLISGLSATLAGAASAQAPEEPPAVVKALGECRALTDDARRLACYDAAAARLVQAEAKGEIVVVDRARAEKVRRQAFGFSLPSLDIFDRPARAAATAEGKPESARVEPPAQLDRITTTVKRASLRGDGKWVFELEDGAVWLQTDAEPLRKGAKAGSTLEIRRTAMGGYFINVDGQRAIRANRTK